VYEGANIHSLLNHAFLH